MQRIKIDKIESQVAPAEEAGQVTFNPRLPKQLLNVFGKFSKWTINLVRTSGPCLSFVVLSGGRSRGKQRALSANIKL